MEQSELIDARDVRDIVYRFFLGILVLLVFPWGLIPGLSVPELTGGGFGFEYRALSYLAGLTFLASFLLSRRGFFAERSGLALPLGVFVLGVSASLFVRANIADTIEGLYVLCVATGFFFCANVFARSMGRMRQMISVLVVMATGQAIYGVAQVFVLFPATVRYAESIGRSIPMQPRAMGTFTSPNLLCSLLVLTIPIGLALMATSQTRKQRIVWAICVGTMSIGAVLTYSRAGLTAAFGAVVLYLVLALARRGDRDVMLRALVAPIVATVIGVLLIVIGDRVGLVPYGSFVSGLSESWQGRAELFAAAIKMIIEYPLTGVGFWSFDDVLPMFQVSGFRSLYAHSTPLQVAAETGEFGVVGATWIMIAAVLRFLRGALRTDAWGKYAAGVVAGIAGIAVHNIADYSFMIPLILYVVAVAAGAVWGMRGEDIIEHRRFPRVVMILFFVLLLLLSSAITIAHFLAESGWRRVLNNDQGGIRQLQIAAQLNPVNGEYHHRLASAYAVLGSGTSYRDQLFAMRQAAFVQPFNPDYRAAIAAIYAADEGAESLVIFNLLRATELAPKRPDLWVRLGDTYRNRGDLRSAQNAYAAATALLDDYGSLVSGAPESRPYRPLPQTSIDYVQIGMASEGETSLDIGDNDRARAVLGRLIEVFPNNPDGHAGIARYFLIQGSFAEALAAAITALRIDGAQPSYWYVLGEAYRGIGDVTQARIAFENALLLDPRFQPAALGLEELQEGE